MTRLPWVCSHSHQALIPLHLYTGSEGALTCSREAVLSGCT